MARAGALAGWRAGPAPRVAAAVLAGAAASLAFPGPDLGPVAFVALVPLLLAIENVRPRRAAALGYLSGFVFFGLLILWIPTDFLSWTGGVGWLAWVALCAAEACFVAAFAALLPATRRLGAWRVLLLPACWATLELVRAHAPLGGFPWGILGVSQHAGGLLLPACWATLELVRAHAPLGGFPSGTPRRSPHPAGALRLVAGVLRADRL